MTTVKVKRKSIQFQWLDFNMAKYETRLFAFFGGRYFIDNLLGPTVLGCAGKDDLRISAAQTGEN